MNVCLHVGCINFFFQNEFFCELKVYKQNKLGKEFNFEQLFCTWINSCNSLWCDSFQNINTVKGNTYDKPEDNVPIVE